MFGRMNPLDRSPSHRQKLWLGVVGGVFALALIGLGVWGAFAPDSYSSSGNGCVNVTLPGTMGGGILHKCGSAARTFCQSSSVQGSQPLAVREREQCVKGGFLAGSSATPSPH